MLLLLAGNAVAAKAQAVATASGPGTYVAVGGGISGFQADYGRRDLVGGVIYADVHPQWRVGMEGEARFLSWRSAEQVKESSYLGGPRAVLLHGERFEVYGKFLAGVGRITLPFGYARGSFLVYAPGAGLDVALGERVALRLIDVEYQRWPRFSYGALDPYGISAGITWRVNRVAHFPR